MVLDWGTHASSLMVVARNMFRELGMLMNEKRTFTIAGIKYSSIGIGDINQHFDCIHIPNMGGYRFPDNRIFNCNNVILGPSGIDEVVYGKDVFLDKNRWKREEPIIKKEIQRWKDNIGSISAVHVVTNSELEEMNRYLRVPKDKMTIIPHGVDYGFFKPAKNIERNRTEILSTFQIPMSKYFIHISETNWKRKNLLRLLDAFELASEKGLNRRLIVIGKYQHEVFKKAKKLSNVKLVGRVSHKHLVSFLQSADALVLPSIHEGFGLPLIEAMACGVPAITSNIHAPPEVVGNSGLLVDPYDTKDIADKMLLLAKDESLRAELSARSIARAEEFSWRKNAESILELYQKNTGSKKPDNFEENYDLAALRTLTTICEMFPTLDQHLVDSLLKFDYKKMIRWALQDGIYEEHTRDFLLPFKKWFEKNS